MAVEAKKQLGFEEYLASERAATVRHELVDGEAFAMVGASRRHNRLVTNLVMSLGPQLRGGACELYVSDMRVRAAAAGLVAYPDAVVACGERRFYDEDTDTLLDATLIVEVLSRTTADFDRGTKFAAYRTLPSLADYLLVAQDAVRVEHFSRQRDESWRLVEVGERDATIDLPSIGCRLSLADLYDHLLAGSG